MQKNPYYNIIDQVKRRKLRSIQLSFAERCQFHTTQTTRNYYAVELQKDSMPKSFELADERFVVTEAHLSIYEHYHKNTSGMEPLHLTYTLRSHTGQRHVLHMYFDSQVNYCSAQLKDPQDTRIEIDQNLVIFQQLSVVGLLIMDELHVRSEKVIQSFRDRIDAIQNTIDEFTQGLFGVQHKASNKRSVTTKLHQYKKYLSQYHDLMRAFNLYTFTPDIGRESILLTTIDQFDMSRMLEQLIPAPIRKPKDSPTPAPQTSATKSLKHTKKAKSKPAPKINTQQIKVLRNTIKSLNGANTAKAIHRKFTCLKELSTLVQDDIYALLDTFRDLDHIKIEAEKRLREEIKAQKVSHIRLLLDIVDSVFRLVMSDAICTNNIEIIKMVKRKYHGNLNLNVGLIMVLSVPELSIKTMKYLLSHGANPNMIDPMGKTPLMVASMFDRVDKIKLLLAHGADLEIKQRRQEAVIVFSEQPGQDVLDTLQKPSKLHTAFAQAVICCSTKAVKLLLESGADPYAQDHEGFPAVSHCAVLHNDEEELSSQKLELIQVLGSHPRVNIDTLMSKNGTFIAQSMLHYACQFDRPTYVKALLDAGADPNVKRQAKYKKYRNQEITPLGYALSRSRLHLVDLILERLDQLSVETLAEACLIIYTSGGTHSQTLTNDYCPRLVAELTKKLLERAQDEPDCINQLYGTNFARQTVLHIAARFLRFEEFLLLKARGARTDIVEISIDPKKFPPQTVADLEQRQPLKFCLSMHKANPRIRFCTTATNPQESTSESDQTSQFSRKK